MCLSIPFLFSFAGFDVCNMKDYQEEDVVLDALDPSGISQSGGICFWEFVPFENEVTSDELMCSGYADIADSEKEGKSGEARKRNSREDLVPELESVTYRISKKGAEREKSKLVRPNVSNMSSPCARLTRIDDRSSNLCSAEKGKRHYRPEVPSRHRSSKYHQQ